ncbi:hypothetical protein RFI_02212 [Reticulomyxa filosa]|uniref:C2 domain-containing protein n=1 Tax=Reticulomyxa filosa TaxID=46433 RepID=X6P9Q0_RETFI|nr:hypothetical protein RFI_02212 [Reticulomyxa filosa]|eukprot:ETO34876.1 hypothetical protein RFI_02212 [Reticulomyxa filosa]
MSSLLHVRAVEATGLPVCFSYFKAYIQHPNSNTDGGSVWTGKVVGSEKIADPLWNQSHTFNITKDDVGNGWLVIEVIKKRRKSADVWLGECKYELKQLEQNKHKQYRGWLPIRYKQRGKRRKMAHSANNSQDLDDTTQSLKASTEEEKENGHGNTSGNKTVTNETGKKAKSGPGTSISPAESTTTGTPFTSPSPPPQSATPKKNLTVETTSSYDSENETENETENENENENESDNDDEKKEHIVNGGNGRIFICLCYQTTVKKMSIRKLKQVESKH